MPHLDHLEPVCNRHQVQRRLWVHGVLAECSRDLLVRSHLEDMAHEPGAVLHNTSLSIGVPGMPLCCVRSRACASYRDNTAPTCRCLWALVCLCCLVEGGDWVAGAGTTKGSKSQQWRGLQPRGRCHSFQATLALRTHAAGQLLLQRAVLLPQSFQLLTELGALASTLLGLRDEAIQLFLCGNPTSFTTSGPRHSGSR